MGKFRDAAGMGFAFKPDPWTQAGVFADWHPINDPADALDLPESCDFALTPWSATSDQRSRIELSEGIAWRHRRIFGQVIRIEECEAENTRTPYRIEILVKIPFLAEGHPERIKSHLFAIIRAYSPNAAITDSCPLMLGDALQGVVTANYGGSGNAQLDGWRHTTADDWHSYAPDTFMTDEFGQVDGWTYDWTPRLGGSGFAFFAPGENRINSVRMCVPPEDPHIFIRIRRAKINEEDS